MNADVLQCLFLKLHFEFGELKQPDLPATRTDISLNVC